MNAPAPNLAQSVSRVEHPLRNAGYRRWLLGAVVSLLGDQCYVVALPWLILQLGSPGMLGTVLMAGALPRAVLMLMGGAVTDRVSARRIMLSTTAARAVCAAALGTLAWLGALALWEVYALVILFGIADAFAMPAQSAFVPSLLAREQLVASTSLQQVLAQLTGIAGPVMAGLAVARLGVAAAFWADAASFLTVIGALLTLPDPPRAQLREGTVAAIASGFAYVRRDAALSALLAVAAATNLCGAGPFTVGLAYLAKSHLQSSSAFGVWVSALAVGGLMGALAAGLWKIRRPGALILGCTALVSVCLMSLVLAPALWSTAALLCVIGAIEGLANVQLVAWVMRRIEPEVRGRVSSVIMLSSLGLMPVSMGIAGFVAQWGAAVLFLGAGVALLAVTGAAASVRAVREIE